MVRSSSFSFGLRLTASAVGAAVAACSLLGPTSGISGGDRPSATSDASTDAALEASAADGGTDSAIASDASLCERNRDAALCDDFDDGVLADQWNLVFDPPGDANRDAGLTTSSFRSAPNAAEFFRGANGGDVSVRRALSAAVRGVSCEFSFFPEAWTGWGSVGRIKFASTYGAYELYLTAGRGLCVIGGGPSACGDSWDGRVAWRRFRVTVASAKEADDAGALAGLRRVFVEDVEPASGPSPHFIEERFVANTDPYLLDVAFEVGAIDQSDGDLSPTHVLVDDVVCTVTP